MGHTRDPATPQPGTATRLTLPPPSLQACLLDFLLLMGDADHHVRKAAVVTLAAVLHQQPSLVVGALPRLLPLLYEQTKVRPELVRTVDLGPFKHRIDDGLDLRKAAFECMDVLLDAAGNTLDKPTFITFLVEGGWPEGAGTVLRSWQRMGLQLWGGIGRAFGGCVGDMCSACCVHACSAAGVHTSPALTQDLLAAQSPPTPKKAVPAC